MRIALIYNRNQRVCMGERSQKVLEKYKNLIISQFDLQEIQGIKNGYDLYFRIDDGGYVQDIPADLHPCCWWISDTHLPKPYKTIKGKIKKYDFVFCTQKHAVEKLFKETGKSAYWIPWACDEIPFDFEFPQENSKVWDICFIGTSGKYSLRKVILELIRINYPNSFIGRATYHEILDYYRKSRIVVNYSINNDINARVFEAMSAGALLITNRINNNGFEEIFHPGEHLVIFEDMFRDLKENIDFYLQNITERQRIAKRGFRYTNQAHTYRDRLRKMFEIMGINLNK
jgi:spore maturation protein CgeB